MTTGLGSGLTRFSLIFSSSKSRVFEQIYYYFFKGFSIKFFASILSGGVSFPLLRVKSTLMW